MKLKTKIMLFSSLFMLFVIVLVNSSIYVLFHKIAENNELEQLSDQTNALVETMRENEDIPSNQIIQAFVPTNGIIRVLDVNEKEVTSTITKRKEFTELQAEYSNAENQKIVKSKSGTNVAVVSKPIIWENGDVVTLQVANFLIPLEETMQTLRYVLVAASLMMFVPVMIAGNVLSRFILHPIHQIIMTMKENRKDEQWKTIELHNRSQDELYQMESTFNEMITHLRENYEKQETFVSDASHELKTPISIIKSYAQLMKRRGKSHPEVLDESIDAIDIEADRMHQLVDQMLTLAKTKQVEVVSSVDMIALTEKVIHTFKTAYQREIVFHTDRASLCIQGNEDQLEQIIYNLLDIAITYSEKEINVFTSVQDGDFLLQVADLGVGISPRDQERIFHRFYRIDQARTRSTGGTGLGLSIAKAIVEAHGGQLRVESDVGKGSVFTVRFPLDS